MNYIDAAPTALKFAAEIMFKRKQELRKVSTNKYCYDKKRHRQLAFTEHFFILVSITAFLTSNVTHPATRDDGRQQKFDTFVSNVQSGKWQLTTDKWIEVMRSERATTEAYRETLSDMTRMMQVIGVASLAGFLLQTVKVFSARKKLLKP